MSNKQEVIQVSQKIIEILESLPHLIYEVDEQLKPYADNDVIYCANDVRYWAQIFEDALEKFSEEEPEDEQTDEYDSEISETLRLAGVQK